MKIIPWKHKQTSAGQTEPTASSLVALRHDMDRLYDTFIREPFSAVEWPFTRSSHWSPAVDVAESEDELTVRVELPGMDAADIDITVTGNQLTIAGKKIEVSEQQGKDFYHTESRSGCFRRSVPLPASVDSEKSSATFNAGVLVVRLEKAQGRGQTKIGVKCKKPQHKPKKAPGGKA